jgi:hypothetical protein
MSRVHHWRGQASITILMRTIDEARRNIVRPTRQSLSISAEAGRARTAYHAQSLFVRSEIFEAHPVDPMRRSRSCATAGLTAAGLRCASTGWRSKSAWSPFVRPCRVPRVYLGSAFRAILAILASFRISNLRVFNGRGRSESRRSRQFHWSNI